MQQTKLSPEIITAAIRGFEADKQRIDNRIAELRSMLEGGRSEAVAAAPPDTGERKRKRFSAAARRKMAMAQRARWAAIKQPSEPTAKAEIEKPKRKVSAAARRKMAAAQKARWAKVKGASEPQPAVVKKAAAKKVA
jgi:hypothetical protein